MNAIVIPTYNERGNIGSLLPEIISVVPHARIIVVDDNSPDRTAEKVRQLQKKYPQIDLLVRTKEKGRGGACIAGFMYVLKKYPSVAYVIEMDADFSHDPVDIPSLFMVADKKTVIIGSRYTKGSRIIDWPKWRLFLSILANWYIRFFLGIKIADYTMGFRCYSREALQAIDFNHIRYTGFITLSEMAYALKQKGYSFKEIPITLKDRTRGKSNATIGEVLKSFVAIINIRMRK